MGWRRHSAVLLLIAGVLGAVSAQGQRVVALTEARNASGQAAQAYVQVVDFAAEARLPGAIQLPGATVNAAAFAADRPAGYLTVAPSAQKPGGAQWAPGFVAGFNPVTQAYWGHRAADPGGAFPFAFVTQANGDDVARLVLVHRGRTDAGHRLDVYPLVRELRAETPPGLRPPPSRGDQGGVGASEAGGELGSAGAAESGGLTSIPLPFAPQAATRVGEFVIALTGLTESRGLWVAMYDETLTTEPVLSAVADLPQGFVNPRPAAMAASADGTWLAAAVSGRRLEGGSSIAETLLYVFSAATLELAGPALALPGDAIANGAVLGAGADGWWVTTADAEGGFAYATRCGVGETGPAIALQETFFNAVMPITAAADADGAFSLALRERLILRQEDGALAEHSYGAPLHALAWADGALFAGEAGRVHLVDPATSVPAQTVQLQTGFVTQIFPLPLAWLPEDDADGDGLGAAEEAQLGTAPDNADSDGDGIPDGADPQPAAPTPTLDVPPLIMLSGAAAGQELRSFVIEAEHGGDAVWQIDFDRPSMPWLVLYPEGGKTPGRVLLGVNPEFAPGRDALLRGELIVSLATVDGEMAAHNPAAIKLLVTPPPDSLRRIGWLWPEADAPFALREPDDPRRFKGLADMLAGPPHYFVQEEIWGAVTRDLAQFNVVVFDIAAAQDQALSRQAVLDYVAAGGSMLIIGRHLGAGSSTSPRWLAPAGLHIDTTVAVNGVFPFTGDHELAAPLEALRLQQGCLVRVDAQEAILAPNPAEPNAAAFAAFPYGLGRIAVLAGPLPLLTPVLYVPEHRAFAGVLFEWLARAPREVRDQDGDGLSDDGEDMNDNGRIDPGETDYLNPDSDGDGIPDAMEDLNRNGWLDAGETNPLLADTDGDGINDGADAWPTPDAEAPYVATVTVPNKAEVSGPSEGGTYVSVRGSNFTADSEVWFGNEPAAHTRKVDSGELLAVTPPYPNWAGGSVGVRVVNEAGQTGLLPFGFTYTGRSVARIVFNSINAVAKQAGVYEGTVEIHVQAPEAAVGRGHLYVAPQPRALVRVTDVQPGAGTLEADRTLIWQPLSRGLTRLTYSSGKDMVGLGHLATFRWTATLPPAVDVVRFSAVDPFVTARNGAPLVVELEPAEIVLPKRIAPAAENPVNPP